jgi:inorganic pyrophosphatase
MIDLLRLPHHLDGDALTCRAIVETEKGNRSKFDYDPETGLFELAGCFRPEWLSPWPLGSSLAPRQTTVIPSIS